MTKHIKTFMMCVPTVLFGCSVAYASNLSHYSAHGFVGLETAGVFLSPSGNHIGRRFTNIAMNLGNFKVSSGSNGFNVGAFAGYGIDLNRHWFSGYRFALEGTHLLSSVSVRGNWDYTLHLPANHYGYRYSLDIQTLGANLAVDVYRWQRLALFLQGGAGLDWLKTKNFDATPKRHIDDPVTFHFMGAQKTNLYYQGKVGLRYTLNHCAFSIAYVYANLGKASTGVGTTRLGAHADALEDSIKTHAVQLAFTYNF